MKRYQYPFFRTLIVCFFILVSCKYSADKKGQIVRLLNVDDDFSTYVEEYSSGIIPVKGPFSVKLTSGVATELEHRLSSIDLNGLFDISPRVKGECTYSDGALSYKPTGSLDEGTEYVVSFNLKNILPVPAKLEVMKFNVFTQKRNFSVDIDGLKAGSGEKKDEYSLEGRVKTSIYINPEDIEKVLTAGHAFGHLKIEWEHRPEENLHLFSVKGIKRSGSETKVVVEWNGNPIRVDEKGSQDVEVPALGDFRLIQTQVIHQPDQKVKLIFSDALDSKQDLEGLIELSKTNTTTQLSVDGNQVTIYPGERISGAYPIEVNSNIRNREGKTLPKTYEWKLNFELMKPALRLPGRGVILPDNGDVNFPFEAVNLKAVDLRIVKVFASNMNSFLQNSSLKDTYDMKRVGRLIFSKRVDLVTDQYINLNKWNAFSIDLSKYISIEKGSIYEVEIGMQKAYSLYPCQENADKPEEVNTENQNESEGDEEEEVSVSKKENKTYDANHAVENEKEYWDDPDKWRNKYYDNYYYNWRQRENPCSRAYYTPDRTIRRNILVSNIGLTAKTGLNNELLVACADLKTALPMSGVKLEILNYQLQNIGNGSSNSEGFASIPVTGKPFLLIATQNDQKSYLKLNESNALSLSQFDVSGEKNQKGLKAFIYGERGVWHPGDSIYVSVLIDDRNAQLPENHPVNFKLLNPKGQIIQELLKPIDRKRLITFRTATLPDAETGIWNAVVTIGGAEFTRHLRIETIKPNRLKIDATFPNDIIESDSRSSARVESSWLTGVKAPSLHAIAELTLRAGKTRFDKFPLFTFDDPTKVFKYETKTILDANTDDQGRLSLPLSPGDIGNAPGILNADYTIRIFEPGGDASIRQFTKKFSPYAKYAGLQVTSTGENRSFVKVDENSEIKVVSVNPTGRTVSDQIDLMIYKIEWRWWWESSDENIGSYINHNHANLVLSKEIHTGSDPVKLSGVFKSMKWGRYLVVARSSSGHSSSMTVYNNPDYYYGEESANQATMLSFTSDKSSYRAGEKIRVRFPAPDKGRALVTIEDGSKIIDKFWAETSAGNNELTIKATGEMAPCSYIHISLIQPYGQRNNDNPIRMYGIIPVPIENPDSRLSPVLKVADELKAEKQVSLTVSEKNGKAMNYTIAMVDEGLLDITGFTTPDPWSGMYQREALGVKTWDLYDDVLGAFGGRLEKLFAIGGDLNPVDPSRNKASRFKPVVHFEGPFRLERGQTHTHSFKLPPYTGSVRTMIIAGNTEGAYGSSEKTSKVISPLMLLPVAPRTIGFDEEITIPVSVFAQKNNLKNVQVKMTCSKHFSLVSGAEQSLIYSAPGEKTIDFRINSSELAGIGTIELTASSGAESTRYELNIPVKSRELPISKTATKIVAAGQTDNQTLTPFGVKGSNRIKVTVSGLPSPNLSSRLEYLIQYPHGCTEQIVSSVFPQLYLAGIQELDASQKSQISIHIQAGLDKLKKHQNTDGSFGFWPGSASNDEWLTNYVGHFFCEAERKGFVVQADMKKSWLMHQARIASEWKGTFPYQKVVQAYRLYTLALAGKPVYSAMNRLREDKNLPVTGRWFLAGAYAEGGRPEAAWELIDMQNTNTPDSYTAYTYGDQTRDRAMLLLCMIRMNDQNNILTLYKHIAESLNTDEWMSTQTTSFALSAACKTLELFKASQKGLNYSFTTNGTTNENIKTTATFSTAYSGELTGNQRFSVKNNTQGTLFVNYYNEGIPNVAQSEKIDRKLKSAVKFLNRDRQPVHITELKQGTDLIAFVTVTNQSMEDVDNCALTFQVPSGWEVRNTRLYNQTTGTSEEQYEYRDFRDDRVLTYFRLNKGQTKTFVMLLNASYPGKFYFPNIQTEAMYDKSYLSVIPGMWVEVVK
jgi:alpha-2-macroglobulin